jgi:hypothetical protein
MSSRLSPANVFRRRDPLRGSRVRLGLRCELFGNRPQASTMVEMSVLDGEGIEIEINAIAAVPL